MKLIFPNSQRINRGNYRMEQLLDACRANDVTDVVMVQEHRGVPGEQLCYSLGYSIVLFNVVFSSILKRNIKKIT